jgi:hypothetical protein
VGPLQSFVVGTPGIDLRSDYPVLHLTFSSPFGTPSHCFRNKYLGNTRAIYSVGYDG